MGVYWLIMVLLMMVDVLFVWVIGVGVIVGVIVNYLL